MSDAYDGRQPLPVPGRESVTEALGLQISPVPEPNPRTEADESDGLVFHKMVSQPYTNCEISAGFVDGHPVDTLYLRLEKDGIITTELLLRPDEMAAIAWCAAGALWADHMRRMDEEAT